MTDRTISDLHAGLPDRILADAYWGETTLKDPNWRAAFDAVPRHWFAPATWYEWTGDTWVEHRRADDEDAWARAVYAVDQPLITQVGPDGKPTCSLSAPFLVAAMLGGLDLQPGMRVLESGTGTGWTAALMSRRLGKTGHVASVEYDPALAAQAILNVTDAGTYPAIQAGDGEAGLPGYAPFDRVAATHAVWRVPAAWIAQTRPGGLVCAPLAVSAAGLDLYVRLTVHGDGSASGPVLFPVAFMRSRTETSPATAGWADDEARTGTTNLDLPAVHADERMWVLLLAVPGLTVTGPGVEDGDDCMWLSTTDGSWAVAWVPQGTPWRGAVVEQHGPADVWTLAEAAWARWEAAGRPGLNEFGLTVTPDGIHKLWMQTPDNVVAVL